MTSDLNIMDKYYKEWRLTPNPAKSEVTAFHLNNWEASRTLNVSFGGVMLKHNPNPVYLGLTLDRSLTFKNHLSGLSKKIAARVNIIQKLAGSSWGASANTLRTATLALVFSPAEYVAPAWKNSAHVSKVDTQLNQAMRIITGCIRPTDVHWLPVLSNIAPPTIRREKAAHKIYSKFRDKIDSLLFNFITNIPPARLKSRQSPFLEINETFDGNERWKRLWSENRPFNGELIQDPSEEVPGFDLPRSIWTYLNRFRTGQGRCNYQLQKWG